jgi:hypothetical protein
MTIKRGMKVICLRTCEVVLEVSASGVVSKEYPTSLRVCAPRAFYSVRPNLLT